MKLICGSPIWESSLETNFLFLNRFLVQERERLQAAREKVREQRRTLQTMTPAGKAQKLPSQEKANKRTHPRAPKQPAWEYDALAFLKTLGLYHHVEKPIFLPTPPRRRRRRKFRYYPCPLNRRFAWTWWTTKSNSCQTLFLLWVFCKSLDFRMQKISRWSFDCTFAKSCNSTWQVA